MVTLFQFICFCLEFYFCLLKTPQNRYYFLYRCLFRFTYIFINLYTYFWYCISFLLLYNHKLSSFKHSFADSSIGQKSNETYRSYFLRVSQGWCKVVSYTEFLSEGSEGKYSSKLILFCWQNSFPWGLWPRCSPFSYYPSTMSHSAPFHVALIGRSQHGCLFLEPSTECLTSSITSWSKKINK